MSDPERKKPDIASVYKQISREQLAALPPYLGLDVVHDEDIILARRSDPAIVPITDRILHVKQGTVDFFEAYFATITPHTLLLQCSAYGARSQEGNPVPILVVEFVHRAAVIPAGDDFSGALDTHMQVNFIPTPYSRVTKSIPIGISARSSVIEAKLVFAPY